MKDNEKLSLYSDMAMDEAVSHKVHSGIFEIMGYLSMIDKTNLLEEDRMYLSRAEELCKTVISELHDIIDNYRD